MATDEDSWAAFAARLLAVGLFGAVGCACRLEISSLQKGDDQIFEIAGGGGQCDSLGLSASGFFVQNIVGSFFIAMVVQRNHHMPDPIHTGWSTGFSGSLTTFATWMQYTAVLILSGHANLAWATHCSCLCFHKLGHLLAQPGYCTKVLSGSDDSGDAEPVVRDPEDDEDTSSEGGTGESEEDAAVARKSSAWTRRREVACMWLWPSLGAVAGALTLARLCTAIAAGERDIWVAVIMAPFGAVLRCLLSIGNKRWCPGIPWFTLLANLLGCAADAVMVWQLWATSDEHATQFWKAFGAGFGGSLSTVSTFVGELRGTKIPHLREQAVYTALSHGLAMAILLPVNFAFSCD